MDLTTSDNSTLAAYVTKLVMDELAKYEQPSRKVKVGVSNRHIHLDRTAMDVLFGRDSELRPKKKLGQPGQFAAEETVTLRGSRGELKRVRVLGPLRAQTQVEICVTDGFAVGVKPPVRESSQLEGTPGIEVIGPKGSVVLEEGVIVALRHIHMHTDDAKRFGVKNGQIVKVKVGGDRGGVLDNVVIRVSPKYALEMHIDVDEANGLGIATGDYVEVLDSNCEA
ncbi:phosphate propanoyltransferase [Paratractidigestivibacter sp.]|uniref:phosphate propanoyltransferase n=1 Tax=Paratractidigestivibacter sp. TaxID=2847316 RepID=UPI002ABE7CA1|nr:phosphate propanoyltransferase [Paratractidigestivibacter sp.]